MKKSNDNNTQVKSNAVPEKKHSSALAAAAKGARATDHVKPSATRDINGSSGTSNTGTSVNYEDKE